MNSQSPDKLDSCLAGLCELWGKEVTPTFYAMYRSALLSVLTFDEAVHGLNLSFVKKSYGFPKPADIIEWIRGDEDTKAMTAWGSLLEAIETAGPNKTVVFDDPKIAHVVNNLGGWQQVCMWQRKDTNFQRKDFIATYKAVTATENVPLLGNGEIQCNLHNRPELIPPPVMIGHTGQKQIEHHE
jgi:hypothetical protein